MGDFPEHCQLRHWAGGFVKDYTDCACSFNAICHLMLLKVGYGVVDDDTM